MSNQLHQHSARNPRPLFQGVLVVASLALLLTLFLMFRTTFDPQARSQAEIELYRQNMQAERLQWADDIAGIAWRLLPVGLVAATGVVGLLALYKRFATQEMLRAQFVVKALEAQHQPGQLPATLHYNPRTSGSGETARLALPPALDAVAHNAIEDVPVPTFSELLTSGQIGKGNPLLLGVDLADRHELEGSWLDLYATATAGLPGSGKTTSQRFFAAQTALHGAKFVVCDPHAEASEDSLAATLDPLSGIYLCEPASEPKDILSAVQFVAEIGHRRIKGLDNDRTPIVLWVDELTSLLGRSDVGDELASTLERIVQEYRKRFVYLSASGQIWTASRTTSELRDSFASVLCHRMKRSQARLLLPTEEAKQVERLDKGQAVLWRTSGVTTTVQIPLTTAADIRRVAGLLTADAPTIPRLMPTVQQGQPSAIHQPAVSHNVAAVNPATSPLESDKTLSADAARAVSLFMQGQDIPAIVGELRGVKSNQGAKYQQAAKEVSELLREAYKTCPAR